MLKRRTACLFFTLFLLVAAFKLLPCQSRWIPQLQRNQLGYVGWRLMGNLLISPPCVPICMNSPARGSTLPPQETWSFKCRSLSFFYQFLCEIKKNKKTTTGHYYLTNRPFSVAPPWFWFKLLVGIHVMVHCGDVCEMKQPRLQNAFCALIDELNQGRGAFVSCF